MSYTAWSVVYGEQPTAAKWNQLGSNDAGFKDATNIDDNAIISRHYADNSVLSDHVDIIPTTDANGWGVIDLGTTKIYKKRVTFSQTIAGLAVLSISSTNLPVGVSTIGNRQLMYNYHVTSNSGVLEIVREGNSGSAALQFTTATTDTGSRAYTGYIDLLMVE